MKPLTVDDLGTVLSLWAHPDDETYLAGGVMAAARDRGQRVVCASATAGELGTDDPVNWPPLRLASVRRWEARASMSVLGVTEHRVLAMPDGALSAHDRSGMAWADCMLDHIRPDTILTFGPDGMTFHPDHVAVHRWVTHAWERRGRPCRLLYATSTTEHICRFGAYYEDWGMYMTDERPRGVPARDTALHLELAGRELDRKVTALLTMTSQTADLVARIGLDLYAAEVAEEAFVDAENLALGAAGTVGR